MKEKIQSVAVQLSGFSPREINIFDATFAVESHRSYRYFRLPADSLQRADISLVNADNLQALATLTQTQAENACPILLIGTALVEMPFLAIARPIRWLRLFDALDQLISQHRHILSQQNAETPLLAVGLPERRRRERLDLDLTDPRDYEKMRSRPPQTDRILVVDRDALFRDDLALTMLKRLVPVEWVGDSAAANEVYTKLPISIILINPQLSGLDPYFFCRKIKQWHNKTRITVIFLADRGFAYDPALAQQSGCDGFLMRDLGQPQIFTALSKFLLSPA